jgi:hypothetical protein
MAVLERFDPPRDSRYRLLDTTAFEIDERLEVAALTGDDGFVRCLMQFL